jgi:predicted transcriptional regulator
MQNIPTFDDVQKPLTFDSISPVWAERLGQQQLIPLSFNWIRWCLEMISFSKCVVGEAHGFSSSYTSNCQECGRIGSVFALCFTTNCYSKLQEYKQMFVKHWNEKHYFSK